MELSGREWCQKNESKYPGSSDIEDLAAEFKDNVKRFIKVLKDGGVNVVVESTFRHKTRQRLMYYSWMIAYEKLDPKDVPKVNGVNITWDHGKIEESIKGAREMLARDCFNVTSKPATKSTHASKKAIDLVIRWKKDLLLGPLPDNSFRGIVGGVRNGSNKELHEIGRLFGVVKCRTSKNHWSINGK